MITEASDGSCCRGGGEVGERQELTVLAEGHSACWPTSARAVGAVSLWQD